MRRFTTRASNMRTRMDLPTTPSSSVTSSPSPPPPPLPLKSESVMTPKENEEKSIETEFAASNRGAVSTIFEADQQSNRCNYLLCSPFCGTTNTGVLDSQGM